MTRPAALFATIGLAFAVAAAPAIAYPTGPVRLVVAFAPGGGTDGAARIVAERLAGELGQPVIVENRAGAGGTIGAQSVARAAPDGQTLFFGTGAELLVNPITRKTAPYDLLKDFAPITEVGGVTFVLVVPDQSPARDVRGLVAQAAGRDQGLNFSSFGSGSTNHLIGELFRSRTGIRATHVPYKGSQPAMFALLAGEVDYTFDTAAIALPQIRAGKLRALATPSPERLPDLPEVPTLRESGFPDLVAEGWMGVFAPAGTPPTVIARIDQAMRAVLAVPDVSARLTARGVKVGGESTEAYGRKLADEMRKWREVVAKSGLTLAD